MTDKDYDRAVVKQEKAIMKIEENHVLHEAAAKRRRMQRPPAHQEPTEILSLGEAMRLDEAAALEKELEKEVAALNEVLENERKLNEQHAAIAARIASSETAKKVFVKQQPLDPPSPPRRMLSGFSPTEIETQCEELDIE